MDGWATGLSRLPICPTKTERIFTMHFRALAVLRIPHVEEDLEETNKVKEKLTALERTEEYGQKDILRRHFIQKLMGQLSSFARVVLHEAEDLMYPYGSESKDCYEFFDQKSDVVSSYEHQSCDCVRLPGGRIVPLHDYSIRESFIIQKGLVFQKTAGHLQHPMRTHKAKKMKAFPKYPFRKLYKTLHEYATDYCNYDYDEATGGYGYYLNPNAMWDFYRIGGRWPITFLVKDTCAEYSLGERTWGSEETEFPCPNGYMWVSAARKKDIEWSVMKEWYQQQAKKRFLELESMFVSGLTYPDRDLHVKDGCVYRFQKLVYKIGEPEEDYLARCSVPNELKYPVSFCDLIDSNGWLAQKHAWQSPEEEKQLAQEWEKTVQQHIEDLDGEAVLVSIDYHM